MRQLWDWKRSVEIERLTPHGLELYARMCGWTLARAHARSGDRIAIAAYLGAGDAFDTRDRRVLRELRRPERARPRGAGRGDRLRPHRSRGALSVARKASAGAAGLILMTLCVGQFLMMLDSSVMNVSIATVAKDVGTTVTGIQTAITLYTLVMASFMITGGKIGQIIGRKRAFAIGCVIYGCGSMTTALAPNLPVLLIGWSGLEGLGAALILPAIVALVAANFDRAERPRAYGLVTAAAAVAVAVGPIVGGFFTTYLSWRYVFAGEVLIVVAILVLARRIEAGEPERKVRLDLVGTALSAARPRADRARRPPLGDLGLRQGQARRARVDRALAGDLAAPRRRRRAGALPRLGEPPGRARRRAARRPGDPAGLGPARRAHLVLLPVLPPGRAVLRDAALPLDRPRALGDRNRRAPAAALLRPDPRRGRDPESSSRTSRRAGSSASASSAMFAGLVVLVAALEAGAGAEIVTWPLLLAGLGMGALASQLGSVTVSSVPDEQSGEVGGLQNTVTNLGISVGTALTGAIIIAALSSSFLTGVEENPAVPAPVKARASTELSGGIPFLSDDELETALDEAPGSRPRATDAIVEENEEARLVGLRTALAVLALLALVGLALTGRIPTRQPAAAAEPRSLAEGPEDRALFGRGSAELARLSAGRNRSHQRSRPPPDQRLSGGVKGAVDLSSLMRKKGRPHSGAAGAPEPQDPLAAEPVFSRSDVELQFLALVGNAGLPRPATGFT